MAANRAVVVDPEAPGRLVIREVAEPVPDRSEAVVRVRAISLTRREARRSRMAAAGWPPAREIAGEAERPAATGSGPRAGARVVGLLPEGAWAEHVAIPTHALAELPDKVTFSQAATFPVAGLTALHALAKGGLILGRRVLVTGATGGVGDFAVQLARLGFRRGHLPHAGVLRHRPRDALRLLPLHRARERARLGRPPPSRRAGGGGAARAAREPGAAVERDRPGRPGSDGSTLPRQGRADSGVIESPTGPCPLPLVPSGRQRSPP